MEIAEPGGSLDAGKRGGAEAASSLATQVTLIVEAIEKGSAKNLQEKPPPYLAYKRRSRVGRPLRYPQFGCFFYCWDLFYSLVMLYAPVPYQEHGQKKDQPSS